MASDGVEYIVVKIDDIDTPNRSVHVLDKTNSRFQASFREAPGGMFYVPQQGELWTAKRLGYQWHLDYKLDHAEDQEFTSGMSPGDMRVSNNNMYFESTGAWGNGLGWGPTVNDVFYITTPQSVFVLAGVPAGTSGHSIQIWVNGALIDPNSWAVSDRTITIFTPVSTGPVVVQYQTWSRNYFDEGTVRGSGQLTAIELYGYPVSVAIGRRAAATTVWGVIVAILLLGRRTAATTLHGITLGGTGAVGLTIGRRAAATTTRGVVVRGAGAVGLTIGRRAASATVRGLTISTVGEHVGHRVASTTVHGISLVPGPITVSVAGKASAAAFGTMVASNIIIVPGKTSVATIGTVQANMAVPIAGKSTVVSFGTVQVNIVTPVPGKTSEAQFGAAAFNINVSVAGKTSVASIGTIAKVNITVSIAGRVSVASIGAVAQVNITVPVPGQATAAVIGGVTIPRLPIVLRAQAPKPVPKQPQPSSHPVSALTPS